MEKVSRFGICSPIHCGHFGVSRQVMLDIAKSLIVTYHQRVRVFKNPSYSASRTNYANEVSREFDNMTDLILWIA